MLEVLSLRSSDLAVSISASPMVASDSGYIVRISEISYQMLALDTESRTPSAGNSNPIEKCQCPAGYIGASCQECADGFYHTFNLQLGIRECTRCQCNGHSTMCNKRTGECQNCQDDTVGSWCQHCKSGFYDNASDVSSGGDGCQRCPCEAPKTTTPECVQSASGDNITCLNCSEGYAGRLCLRCDVGYFFKAGMYHDDLCLLMCIFYSTVLFQLLSLNPLNASRFG